MKHARRRLRQTIVLALPPGSEALLSGSEALLSGSEALPADSEALPAGSEALPSALVGSGEDLLLMSQFRTRDNAFWRKSQLDMAHVTCNIAFQRNSILS